MMELNSMNCGMRFLGSNGEKYSSYPKGDPTDGSESLFGGTTVPVRPSSCPADISGTPYMALLIANRTTPWKGSLKLSSSWELVFSSTGAWPYDCARAAYTPRN